MSSVNDPAGRNIRRHILELLPERKTGDISFHLMEVEGRLISQDGVDRVSGSDLIIFLSRHTSMHPTPLLSVHVTGNFSQADLGGKPWS
ncbi:MAG: D-tyrosyl-tRNA(Tyr) deacylase, partial [Methanomicrobiales archaeon]|nr:D-tyrosyl-tRNA(Tyr) deacylase [Methanomicrobiales archaeon]